MTDEPGRAGLPDLTPAEQAQARAWLRSADRGASVSVHLAMMFRMGSSRVAEALIRTDPRYAAANGDDELFVVSKGGRAP